MPGRAREICAVPVRRGARTARFGLLAIMLAGLVLFVSGRSAAAEPAQPLFESQGPLAITLTADFRKLLSRRSWGKERWYDGSIVVDDDTGAARTLPVRLMLRTGFRTRDNNCSFPQFFIDFSDADTSGTPFSGQKTLPMTTHCRGSASYAEYVQREFIAYRLYNVLTDKSLRVRSARVTYMRADKPVKLTERHAFFVEHFDDLAGRHDAEVVSINGFHPVAGETFSMGVLELFEYMIGNTDWSAAYQHNIVLMQQAEQPIWGVPYDFDFSGLVDARYAKPARQFKTRSVRTRIYRGWCRDREDMQEVVDYFLARRGEIFSLMQEFDWADRGAVIDATRYLEGFYDILDSPDRLEEEIFTQCARGVPVRPDE